MKVHKASVAALTDLSQHGLPMALIIDSSLTLRTFPNAKTFPVHESTTSK